ncbi:MAG: magnesium transporter [Candidatus Undinarchaeales archaeon]
MVKSELSKIISDLKKKRNKLEVFREIPPSEQGFVLLSVGKKLRKKILKGMKREEIKKFCHFLDPDEIEDVLAVLSKRKRKIILEDLKVELKEKSEFFFNFYPKRAAGMMNIDYIEVPEDATVDEVYEHVEEHVERTGKEPVILVFDNGTLKGEIPLHELMVTSETEIEDLISDIPCIEYDAKHRECLKVIKRHPHGRVVVYDDDGSVIGVIYAKDLLDVIQKETTEDLYGFAGVNREEDVLDNMFTKVKYRYKWLIINLFTAFIAASVIGLFQDTISQYVILAVYLPIVAGMGGNAGIQTLAIVVRGLVLKEIKKGNEFRILLREMGAGVIDGAITGLVVAVVAYVINGMWLLGIIVWASIIINLLIACTAGTVIPLTLKKMNLDPASASSIFITTLTDVFGFFIFLILATTFLI